MRAGRVMRGQEGLNVGKVAERKTGKQSAGEQNALTCIFSVLKIVRNNVLQLFRHLGANGGGGGLRPMAFCKFSDI